MKTVDVRDMHPVERHPLIFGSLEELQPGDALQIINDHDPTPLKYQLNAEHPGNYEFEYREAGPVDWRVIIKRLK